jgi:lipopolysaccharide export system protein LptA
MPALALLTAAGVWAAGGQTSGLAFRTFTVEGGPVEVNLRGAGPVEWTGRVTVKGAGITLTADNGLKLWPTADWRDAERVEATGNITVEGEYTTPDKTRWEITGKAASATYDRAAAEGVLRGSVSFRAVNPATGAVVSAAADTMTYNFNPQQFRFDRGDKPVHVEWQEPAPPAAGQPEAEKSKEAPAGAEK